MPVSFKRIPPPGPTYEIQGLSEEDVSNILRGLDRMQVRNEDLMTLSGDEIGKARLLSIVLKDGLRKAL